MISTYLQLDKAKHGDRIKSFVERYHITTREIRELEVECDAIEFHLNKDYLRIPENLHFKDIDNAVDYFEEITDNFMSAFNSVGKVDECLCDCYIDGVRYTPRFDGEAWAIGGEPFIKMFKLTETGENDE